MGHKKFLGLILVVVLVGAFLFLAAARKEQRLEFILSDIAEEKISAPQTIEQQVDQLSKKMDQLFTRQNSLMGNYIGIAGLLITIAGIFIALIALVSYSDVREIFNKTKEAEKILSESISQSKSAQHNINQLRLKGFVVEALINGSELLLRRQQQILTQLKSKEISLEEALHRCMTEHHKFDSFQFRCLMLQWGEIKSQGNAARKLATDVEYAIPAIKIIEGFMKETDPGSMLFNCLAEAKKNLEGNNLF